MCNLRSGSIFVSLVDLSRGKGEKKGDIKAMVQLGLIAGYKCSKRRHKETRAMVQLGLIAS